MAFIKRKKEQMHQNNIVYKKNRLQSILLSQDGMACGNSEVPKVFFQAIKNSIQ